MVLARFLRMSRLIDRESRVFEVVESSGRRLWKVFSSALIFMGNGWGVENSQPQR
jgi:hypothetical protein